MIKNAIFSPCRTWRYVLTRIWDRSRGLVMFIGLNCSTADETQDDPTVRRCVGYVRDWGYGGLIMTNAFAFRATDPRVMKIAPDPVGPMNDIFLLDSARKSEFVIAAWGTHGVYQNRHQNILKLFQKEGVPLYCLGITKEGFPKHPLYLLKNLDPIRYAETRR